MQSAATAWPRMVPDVQSTGSHQHNGTKAYPSVKPQKMFTKSRLTTRPGQPVTSSPLPAHGHVGLTCSRAHVQSRAGRTWPRTAERPVKWSQRCRPVRPVRRRSSAVLRGRSEAGEVVPQVHASAAGLVVLGAVGQHALARQARPLVRLHFVPRPRRTVLRYLLPCVCVCVCVCLSCGVTSSLGHVEIETHVENQGTIRLYYACIQARAAPRFLKLMFLPSLASVFLVCIQGDHVLVEGHTRHTRCVYKSATSCVCGGVCPPWFGPNVSPAGGHSPSRPRPLDLESLPP